MDFYAIQRPIGKINDISELRDEWIKIFDTKNKNEMAQFGLRLAQHLCDFSGYKITSDIEDAFLAAQEWIDGDTNYHKARKLAGAINSQARNESNHAKVKFYRTMAQIACIPHVKFHALWACDYAISFINTLHPNDLDAVRKERNIQIKLLSEV